jgi:adenylate cyclase
MAQSTAVDSLKRLLTLQQPDTLRVARMAEMVINIVDVDTDAAEQYVAEMFVISKRSGYLSGEAMAWNAKGNVADARDQYTEADSFYKKALELRLKIGEKKYIYSSYNNLGNIAQSHGVYDQALEFYHKALSIAEIINDSSRIARAHIQIALIYEEGFGEYVRANDHANTAKLILEQLDDHSRLAFTYDLLGHIQYELEAFDKAIDWYSRSLSLYKYRKDNPNIAGALSNLANAKDEKYTAEGIIDSVKVAAETYLSALRIYQELKDSSGIAAVCNNLGTVYKHLKIYDKALGYLAQSLRIRQRLSDQPGVMETFNTYGDVYYGMNNLPEALRYTERYFQLAQILEDGKFIQKGYKDFSKIYAAMGDFQKAYEYRVKYDELRYQRLDEERARSYAQSEALYADQSRKITLERQQAQLTLQKTQLARNRAINTGLVGGAAALLLVILLLYNRSRIRARANLELAAKNAQIDTERRRADELLANILPESAAAELKAHNVVRPVRYESVTVLFTDFKGFTWIAEQVSPEDLIEELDECFRLFDAIAVKYGLEKIKTIGDSYMCAGGLPTPNTTHPFDAIDAAIEMQLSLKALMQIKAEQGKPVFEMRVGIHTGPVVAGVVGSHKFAYDIWGDTVNTASRLEHSSEPHRINISGTTWALVKDRYACSYRGEIEAKHKGAIAMYFVEY